MRGFNSPAVTSPRYPPNSGREGGIRSSVVATINPNVKTIPAGLSTEGRKGEKPGKPGKGKPHKGGKNTNPNKGGKGGKDVAKNGGKPKGKEAAPPKEGGQTILDGVRGKTVRGIPVVVAVTAGNNLRCQVAGVNLTGMMRWLGSEGYNPNVICAVLNESLGIGKTGRGVQISTVRTYAGSGGRRAPGLDQTRPIPVPKKEYQKVLRELANEMAESMMGGE